MLFINGQIPFDIMACKLESILRCSVLKLRGAVGNIDDGLRIHVRCPEKIVKYRVQ
ncbi:MAG: hypothetical protein WCE92_01335 [Nitrososphaeraceae archaeon]|jgi:hypothetical protein